MAINYSCGLIFKFFCKLFKQNTFDIVLNFPVLYFKSKPKSNLFMNEKPQNVKIAINSPKLDKTI